MKIIPQITKWVLVAILALAGALVLFSSGLSAQTASPFPFIKPTFLDASGNPLASGKLYSYLVGTSTPSSTFTNYLQAGTNANPTILDSAGRASIFLGPRCYKFILQNSAGVQQWEVDGVCDLALLQTLNFATQLDDKVCHASQYTGATWGAKVAACIAVIPSTGGTIDTRGLEGAQTLSTDPFSGITKPLMLLIGGATITQSVAVTVPSTVTMQFSPGSIISVNTGITLSLGGSIQAGLHQILAGSGTATFATTNSNLIPPNWFGALCDGSTNDTAAMQRWLTAITANGAQGEIPAHTTCLTNNLSASGTVKISSFGGTIKIQSLTTVFPGSNTEWILFTGTSSQEVWIDGVIFDGSQVIGTAPNYGAPSLIATNDNISPYTNWSRSYNMITMTAYKYVRITRTQANNFKRAFLTYNCERVEIIDNRADGYAQLADNYAVVEGATDLIFARNELRGLDFENGPAVGISSGLGLLSWKSPRTTVTENNSSGFQFVVKSGDATDQTNRIGNNVVISDNQIIYPSADTSVAGFRNVNITGNNIVKSGDFCITPQLNDIVTVTGNTCRGASVGGIDVEDALGFVIIGNLVADIGQNYTNSNHVPAPGTAIGIRAHIVSVVPKYGVIADNTLPFLTLPPSTVAVTTPGPCVVVDTTTSGAIAYTYSVNVSNNRCFVDTTNLPNWNVDVHTATVATTAASAGDPVVGEKLVGSVSGNISYFAEENTLGGFAIWHRNPTGPFIAAETITGQTSSATWTVHGTPANLYTGNVARDNIDRFTQLNSTSVIWGDTCVQVPNWTPTLYGSSTAGTNTYAANGQVGRAIRCGNQVTGSVYVQLTALDGALAGNVRVPLPFTSQNTTNQVGSCSAPYQEVINLDVAGARYSVVGVISPNTNYIGLYETGDNVTAPAIAAADLGATTLFSCTFTFQAAP